MTRLGLIVTTILIFVIAYLRIDGTDAVPSIIVKDSVVMKTKFVMIDNCSGRIDTVVISNISRDTVYFPVMKYRELNIDPISIDRLD